MVNSYEPADVYHDLPVLLTADRPDEPCDDAPDRVDADGLLHIGLASEGGPIRSTPACPLEGAPPVVFKFTDQTIQDEMGPSVFAVYQARFDALMARPAIAAVFDDRRRTITGLPPELAVRLKLRPDANKRSLMQLLRRVSVQERDVIAGFVDELLAGGVIEHSQSPFGANVVLVRKKSGEGMAGYRMCVDFRQLNRAIEHTQEAWPMRRSDDCVARLAGCKYFTSVDFRSGFWQLPIAPEDKHLLAFRTHSGHFNFSVLPMGLSSASGCFQRVTEFICSGLTDRLDDDGGGIEMAGDDGPARPLVNGGRADDLCIPYIDDVLLATRGTADDHLDKVERFLLRLGAHTVTLRYDKCSFAMSSVDFLGFHVGLKGLQAQTRLLEKLTNMAPPASVSDLKSHEGLFSYYRQFLHGYSAATECFHLAAQAVSHNKSPFIWSAECEAARQSLLTQLTTYAAGSALAFPDFGPTAGEFIIATDAATSGGLGAVLSQRDAFGCEHVIAYASRRLSKSERNYAPTQLECLGVVFAVRKFRWAIYGRSFVILD